MALTAAGLRLAAKAIIVDGENGIETAIQHAGWIARTLYQVYLDNLSILTRHTAEEPFTCPCPPRERELLQFAKDYVTANQHPLFDEAIAIPDGLVITDPAGNYVTTIP